ncbi:MAG: molybdopterin cofactor-binding domain-containing protein, partial [Candidatus Kariarchaeaceae archaeon]
MKNIDSFTHVRGESIYVDDLEVLEGTLHAVVFSSHVAKGDLKTLHLNDAESSDGVYRILTAKDIPGENQIGRILPDEVLFAENDVDFIGQPIALILAETLDQAYQARKRISADIDPKKPIVDPRDAYAKSSLIQPPKISSLGDVDTTWDDCALVVEGSVDIGGQEHLYIETQGAYAFPIENNAIKIISSTQGPTAVQSTSAKVLGISMHKVEVDVRRLGGGFGGKEDQATAWASMAALGAYLTKRPVKIILDRIDDMYMTGKRHPYSADYKMGLSSAGKILAYDVTLFQDAGAAADLSPPVLGRTMFHSTNAYYIPNVKVTGISCKTNVTPNTAFRGFGGPQGMFVIEAALTHAAQELGKSKWELQKINLLDDGDEFHYGQIAKNTKAKRTWTETEDRYQLTEIIARVETFNNTHMSQKKGVSVMPVCFGISFTKSMLN